MDDGNENQNGDSGNEKRRRRSDVDLNVRRLTRAHVEAVCDEYGPDHAWMYLGISRSTLYKWRREWREVDRALAAERMEESR